MASRYSGYLMSGQERGSELKNMRFRWAKTPLNRFETYHPHLRRRFPVRDLEGVLLANGDRILVELHGLSNSTQHFRSATLVWELRTVANSSWRKFWWTWQSVHSPPKSPLFVSPLVLFLHVSFCRTERRVSHTCRLRYFLIPSLVLKFLKPKK
jgi:hypothetical protein